MSFGLVYVANKKEEQKWQLNLIKKYLNNKGGIL